MIKFEKVSKTYKNGTHALYDISLEIKDGEFVYIIGHTGSGKSTLIKLLDGEEIPSSGNVIVSKYNVGKLKKRKVPLYRRNIGVVFQNFRLLEKKKVWENVSYALEVIDVPKKERLERVKEVLKLVDLSDKYSAYPKQLSGGQIQRVAIARAIANRPKLLIADEPTGNLDPDMSNEIISLFERINKEEGTTILIVTHDIQTVKRFPHRTIELNSGHVIRDQKEGLKDEAIPENIKADEYFESTAKIYMPNLEKEKENV